MAVVKVVLLRRKDVEQWLAKRRVEWERRLDQLDAYLDQMKKERR